MPPSLPSLILLVLALGLLGAWALPRGGGTPGRERGPLRAVGGRLGPLGRLLARPGSIARTDLRLARAGRPMGLRAREYLGLRAGAATLAAAAGIPLLLASGTPRPFALLAGVVLSLIAFRLPELWLARRTRARSRAIALALPDAIDLLMISVRAGTGFDGALARVAEATEGPLAEEIRRTLADRHMGRTRREALRDLADRTGVPSVSSFASAIVQADLLGAPVATVLAVQSEALRAGRRQRAEEAAAKAPIKMLFPLVGCIFPAMFIVLLGPALILIATRMVLP